MNEKEKFQEKLRNYTWNTVPVEREVTKPISSSPNPYWSKVTQPLSSRPNPHMPILAIDHPKKELEQIQDDIVSFPATLDDRAIKLKELEDYNKRLRNELADLQGVLRESELFVRKNTPPNKVLSHPTTAIVLFIVLILLLLSIFLSIANPQVYRFITNPCPSGNVTVNDSINLAPLLDRARIDYQSKCSGVMITVNHFPINNDPNREVEVELTKLENNHVNIVSSDAFIDSAQKLMDNQVNIVIYALIINSQFISITNLSSQDITAIYVDGVTNWSNIDKSQKNLPIIEVSYPAATEPSNIFERYVLGQSIVFPGSPSYRGTTPDEVVDEICQTPGAIGYVPLSYAQIRPIFYNQSHPGNPCHLNILSINGKSPKSMNSVKDGSYRFWNLEHLYTKEDENIVTHDFIEYMYSDDNFKKDADKIGYLSTIDLSQDTLYCHVWTGLTGNLPQNIASC